MNHFAVDEHAILKFIIHEPGQRKPVGGRGFKTRAEAEALCELLNEVYERGVRAGESK